MSNMQKSARCQAAEDSNTRRASPVKPGARERRQLLANRLNEGRKPRMQASGRRWREANPLKFREYGNRRRARIAQATVGDVSYDRVLERDGMHCYLCNSGIAEGDLSFDHVVPLVRGGAHSEENIRTAHKSCNFRKSGRLLGEIRDPWLRLVS